MHVVKMSRVTSSPRLFKNPFVALEENIYLLIDEHSVVKEQRPCSIS